MSNLSVIFVLLSCGFAALLLPREFGSKKTALFVLFLLGAVGYTARSSIAVIEEGHEGVVLTFGAAEDVPLDPGLRFVFPWQSIESLDVKDKVFTERYQCMSKDLQEVNVEMTVVYRLKKGSTPDIWRRVAQFSQDIDVAPGAKEILKAITAQHNATEIVQERSKLSKNTKDKLREWLNEGDLELVDCSLAKSSFSPKFDTAIRDKQNALEDANKAVNLLAESKERAKIFRADAMGTADAVVEDALGEAAQIKKSADAKAFETRRLAEAEVKKIRGVGLAEALRLARIVEAIKLNPGVIELEAINAWRGSVPDYKIDSTSGEKLTLMLPTPEPKKVVPTSTEKQSESTGSPTTKKSEKENKSQVSAGNHLPNRNGGNKSNSGFRRSDSNNLSWQRASANSLRTRTSK